MNSTLADRLTSRRVSVALMGFVLSAAVIGVLVPQRTSVGETTYLEWVIENPTLASIAEALQFDQVFSSVWFLLGLVLFTLSLSVATVRMVNHSYRRWRGIGVRPRRSIDCGTIDEYADRAREAGYREVKTEDSHRRFVRHRIGWWASAVMHLGMVISVLAALVSAAYSSQSVIDFSAGETRQPGEPYLYEEAGFFASPPEPGVPIRLDSIEAVQWPNGEVRELVASISIMHDGSSWEVYEISANHPLDVDGYMLYVSPGDFGNAAFVELSGEDLPTTPVRIEFILTAEGEASYSEIQPEGWPNVEARWDPTFTRDDKPLALRVTEGDTVHQVVLDEGETGDFGPYSAYFAFPGQWARLILAKPVAIDIIFFGFMIIGLGSVALYAFVPREFVIIEDDNGMRYSWRAARMPQSFAEERASILGEDGEVA